MKKTLFLRSLGVLISGLSVLALYACDEGGTGGSGGTGSNSASSGQGSTSSGMTGSSSSSGGNLTLSMIDDMEDMNGSILMMDGRQGAWYSYNDTSGMQTPP